MNFNIVGKMLSIEHTGAFLIEECSRANVQAAVFLCRYSIYISISQVPGNLCLWISPCNFLMGIEMKILLIKVLPRYYYREHTSLSCVFLSSVVIVGDWSSSQPVQCTYPGREHLVHMGWAAGWGL
jgi:hypothetical protein